MGRAQAEHNEKLCDHIISLTGFNDWVVTTAFYSALHFVLGKMFPLTYQGKSYKNIDQYYSKIGNMTSKSKHVAIIKLVGTNINAVVGEYRWLFNTCMTARYHSYNISGLTANKARQYLAKIKSNC